MKLKNNINEAIYTKPGVIALKSFYNYAEQKKYKPFGFPITVLTSSDGKKYAQVHAATKYDLIEITNINMDSFLDTYSNKMEFNQNPWSELKLEIYFNPEDFIFYFDNKRVKGYLDLVRTIKEINPKLDIKPDPFWLKPVRFDVEAGGSFVKDFWFHISGNIDVDFITNRKNLFNEFRGVYVAEIPKDVMQCLYKKYKEPVIKNNGPLVKSKGNSRYIELGRRVNENKTNFFDHLDGGWGDVIADTYRESNEFLISIQAKGDYKIPILLEYLKSDFTVYENINATSIDIKMIHNDSSSFNGEEMKLTYKINGPKTGSYKIAFKVWGENILIDGLPLDEYFTKMKEENPYKYRFTSLKKVNDLDFSLIVYKDGTCEYIAPDKGVLPKHTYTIKVKDAVKELAFKHI